MSRADKRARSSETVLTPDAPTLPEVNDNTHLCSVSFLDNWSFCVIPVPLCMSIRSSTRPYMSGASSGASKASGIRGEVSNSVDGQLTQTNGSPMDVFWTVPEASALLTCFAMLHPVIPECKRTFPGFPRYTGR